MTRLPVPTFLIALLGVVAVAVSGPIAADGSAADESSALSNLFGGAASGEPELLSPDVAYVPIVTHASADRIELLWRIEPGYYLYRDKSSFTLAGAEPAALGPPELAEGIVQHDEFFGDVAVWREEARVVLPLSPPAQPGSEATVELAWQGCADIGVCFPPERTTLAVVFTDAVGAADEATDGAVGSLAGSDASPPGGAAGSDASTVDPANPVAASAAPMQSEQGRLAALLGSRGLWLNALTFFGLGLLLAFTPCVLPMIPILSSLIVGRGGEGMSAGRAFGLSSVYVLVMAATYALLGIARRAVGLQRAADAAGPAGALADRRAVRCALAVDVRALRVAGAARVAGEAVGPLEPPERRRDRRGGGHGAALDADRRPLRHRAAGRRADLHRRHGGCGGRRRRAVLPRARHGRAAALDRHLRRHAAAARRRLDGPRQAGVRHPAPRHGDLHALALPRAERDHGARRRPRPRQRRAVRRDRHADARELGRAALRQGRRARRHRLRARPAGRRDGRRRQLRPTAGDARRTWRQERHDARGKRLERRGGGTRASSPSGSSRARTGCARPSPTPRPRDGR